MVTSHHLLSALRYSCMFILLDKVRLAMSRERTQEDLDKGCIKFIGLVSIEAQQFLKQNAIGPENHHEILGHFQTNLT